jgi:hypothetical protein
VAWRGGGWDEASHALGPLQEGSEDQRGSPAGRPAGSVRPGPDLRPAWRGHPRLGETPRPGTRFLPGAGPGGHGPSAVKFKEVRETLRRTSAARGNEIRPPSGAPPPPAPGSPRRVQVRVLRHAALRCSPRGKVRPAGIPTPASCRESLAGKTDGQTETGFVALPLQGRKRPFPYVENGPRTCPHALPRCPLVGLVPAAPPPTPRPLRAPPSSPPPPCAPCSPQLSPSDGWSLQGASAGGLGSGGNEEDKICEPRAGDTVISAPLAALRVMDGAELPPPPPRPASLPGTPHCDHTRGCLATPPPPP